MQRITPSNPWALTDAQAECMDLVIQLEENKVIARERCVSVKTVEQILALAYKKMGARGRVQAAIKWHEWRKHGNKPE